MENRTKICICYVITAFLITAFVYSLVTTHFSSLTKLERVQYEVEEITKVILGRRPDEALLPQIDSYVKKRTQGLWDELFAVKKKLELIEGSAGGGCGQYKRTTTDLQILRQEEPNYALDSIGATIVRIDDEPYHPAGFLARLFGIRHKSNFPGQILSPSMQLGHCYAFKGDKSMFTIRLAYKVCIRAVTIEHIPVSASLTGDISNAPKDFLIYGVKEPWKDDDTFLGTFQYNNSMSQRAQTFHLVNENSYQYCKMKVTSNYGHPNQTCIYRVAVHGKFEDKPELRIH